MPFAVSFSKVNPKIFRPGNLVHTKIDLTESEKKIRDIIVNFCAYHDKRSNAKEPLVARFTGGWVRDKLLGFQSHDIDIAVNTLTGLEFAEGINEYINAISSGHPNPELKTHSIHKIERNPEKSKHLETATTKLFGQEVDIVNLRCEEYAEDSRIPTVVFGTAEEDAYRRDATVNALFYNLQEDKVEDFTKNGLQDLKQGIIRTPLSPFQTFNDDPLRVLRLLRFASTFGFEVATETLDAMSDPKIKEALMLKISRERVGVELTKALTSARPQICLLLLQHLGLHEAVFYLDPRYYPSKDYHLPHSDMETAVKAASEALASADPFFQKKLHPEFYNIGSDSSKPVPTSTDSASSLVSEPQVSNHRLHFWLAVALSHFDNIITGDSLAPVQKHKDRGTLRSHVIRYGVKLAAHDAKVVDQMTEAYEGGMSLFSHSDPQAYLDALTRKDLGLWIRKFGEDWGLMLFYCLFKDLLKLKQSSPSVETQHSVHKFYSGFVAKVLDDKHGLKDAWALKPILNGKETQQVFGKKGGPWLNSVLATLVDIQLENPDLTKDEAKTWLQENKSKWQ